jgi:hypothetical protein
MPVLSIDTVLLKLAIAVWLAKSILYKSAKGLLYQTANTGLK